LAVMEMREAQTTRRSSRLKADRQNAPSWMMKPYETILRQISIVKTEVKKQSK